MSIKYTNDNVLVIADTHLPFEKKGYLDFCYEVKQKKRCGRVVHIGDLVDLHALSYHEHDPDGWSPEDEMKATDKHLKAWFKAFPELYLCRGNHDSLVDRKGKTAGLPKRCFLQFRKIWDLPAKWKDDFVWEFNGVIYEHGNKSGKNAHLDLAYENRQSTVSGHTHSYAGVSWTANEKDCLFGMGVGCGIDRHAYAFEYGKKFKKKPIIGCGVVSDRGNEAQFIKMKL